MASRTTDAARDTARAEYLALVRRWDSSEKMLALVQEVENEATDRQRSASHGEAQDLVEPGRRR